MSTWADVIDFLVGDVVVVVVVVVVAAVFEGVLDLFGVALDAADADVDVDADVGTGVSSLT